MDGRIEFGWDLWGGGSGDGFGRRKRVEGSEQNCLAWRSMAWTGEISFRVFFSLEVKRKEGIYEVH